MEISSIKIRLASDEDHKFFSKWHNGVNEEYKAHFKSIYVYIL